MDTMKNLEAVRLSDVLEHLPDLPEGQALILAQTLMIELCREDPQRLFLLSSKDAQVQAREVGAEQAKDPGVCDLEALTCVIRSPLFPPAKRLAYSMAVIEAVYDFEEDDPEVDLGGNPGLLRGLIAAGEVCHAIQ